MPSVSAQAPTAQSPSPLVVYAGRDGRGRDQYVRSTLTGVSRQEASKAHAELMLDIRDGRSGPARSLTSELVCTRRS